VGIIVSKDNDRNSELNQRITADLRARAVQSARDRDPDLVDDSEYLKNLKKTGRFSWLWFVLIVLALISLVEAFNRN
jgi:hypothetical protein